MKTAHCSLCTPAGALLSHAWIWLVVAATIEVAPQPASGSPDSTFVNGSISYVNSIAVQSDGEVIVAGGFTDVGGTPRNRIARLNADGSLDAHFGAGAGANGEVHEVEIQADGKILIAGEFTSVQGADRNGIARLNADGTLDTSFNVGSGANGAVHALEVRADGKIVAAGEFTSVNGSPRQYLAQFNADGSIDSSFNASAGPSNPVDEVEIQSDGKVLIGGEFTSVQGAPRRGVARLNADGSLDAGFTTSLSGSGSVTVDEIELQNDGKILVAGSFGSVNGTARSNLARLNADGSVDAGFDARLTAEATVDALAVQSDGDILIGGQLRFAGGGLLPQPFAQLESDGSSNNALSLNLPIFGSVTDIEVQADGKIVLGGGSSVLRLLDELAILGPRILNIALSQNSVQLSISTEVGKSYVLETQTSLSASSWNEVTTQPGDGSVKTFTDATATGTVRFYRVRVK